MLEIEFWNRKKEIQDIMTILNSRPDLITFIYGPINSGKSSLIDEVARRLSNDFAVFSVDLRRKIVRSYEDFIDVLFSIEDGKTDVIALILTSAVKVYSGIPLPENLVEKVLGKNKPKNAFEYVFNVLSRIREKGKMPVLVLDELQTIGDLKIDGLLIYELFNFFVTITKRYHLAHVFAITSDSLFLERVYSEAMLHGRCRYLLVDDFDFETTKGFLRKYGFSEEEIELVWQYFGGKPVYLVEAVKVKAGGGDLRKFCEEMLEERLSVILYSLRRLEDEDARLFEGVLKLFKKFVDEDIIECDRISEEVEWAVRQNIMFLDPRKRLLKPQSRLDLLAIRKVLDIFKK